MSNILSIKNLSKKYRDIEKYILNNFSLNIKKGDFVTLLGISGSGKTTLLNILGTLDSNYTGSVLLDNIDLNNISNSKRDEIRSSMIGIVFQFHNLIDGLTVYENILMPTRAYNNILDYNHINRVINDLGISHIRDKNITNCSGGERQRVAIARALANKPKIILADEPTGNLDIDNSIRVAEIFRRINKEYATTVIVATHNRSLFSFSDQTIEMNS
jgi:lipoprotein-releasing system ATP-binding protein